MQYWLLKSEPEEWSWKQQQSVPKEAWTGVRNYQARNNIRAMKLGDLCFFYHSNTQRAIVGIVKVVKEHYEDPEDSRFSCVDVSAQEELKKPVYLKDIKSNIKLANIPLIKQSRLSVMPIRQEEFKEIIQMSLN